MEAGGVGHGLRAGTRREVMVPGGAQLPANVEAWLIDPEAWALLIYNAGSKICEKPWHAI